MSTEKLVQAIHNLESLRTKIAGFGKAHHAAKVDQAIVDAKAKLSDLLSTQAFSDAKPDTLSAEGEKARTGFRESADAITAAIRGGGDADHIEWLSQQNFLRFGLVPDDVDLSGEPTPIETAEAFRDWALASSIDVPLQAPIGLPAEACVGGGENAAAASQSSSPLSTGAPNALELWNADSKDSASNSATPSEPPRPKHQHLESWVNDSET